MVEAWAPDVREAGTNYAVLSRPVPRLQPAKMPMAGDEARPSTTKAAKDF